MEINEEVLYNQQIESFELLLNLLCSVKYSNKDIILQIEKQTYELLKKDGEDVNGLVTVALAQVMLGNRSKAMAVANNIWEIGKGFDELSEIVYIDILVNLGMLELASILLKPKFESIEDNLQKFLYVMLKFSLITGNINLIDRILNALPRGASLKALEDFANVYKRESYVEHFKNIQRIAFETCKNHLCSYDYETYTDRGFTDLEMFIYVGDDVSDVNALFSRIDGSINAYLQSRNVKKIYNLCFTIKKIDTHPVLIEQD